jgi:hypothetical protein
MDLLDTAGARKVIERQTGFWDFDSGVTRMRLEQSIYGAPFMKGVHLHPHHSWLRCLVIWEDEQEC